MLNPNNDRLDYGKILYAPPNYELDFAIGTTYSLDLDSLIGASIALGLSEETDTNLRENEIFLLNALRSTGDKIALFCENGRIKYPAKITKLFVLLEEMVFQVNVPKTEKIRGYPAFHPKFWLIRYVNEYDEVFYRVIVLSRNLTFDRSWDISFTMDGKKVEKNSKKTEKNNNLTIFLNYLKEFSTPVKSKKISDIIEELKYVEFDLDSYTFEDFDFIPNGVSDNVSIKNCPLCSDNFDDLVIFTPFLSEEVIIDFNKRSKNYKSYQKSINEPKTTRLYLFTRKESLSKLEYEDCDEFYENIYILRDEVINGESVSYDESQDFEEHIPNELDVDWFDVLADSKSSEVDILDGNVGKDAGGSDVLVESISEAVDVGGSDVLEKSTNENNQNFNQYQDIHAKMYFVRKGSQVDLYLGSLNASHNALNGNVEFMVHLKTNDKKFNLEMLLADLFCGKEDGEDNPFKRFDIKEINSVEEEVLEEAGKLDLDSILKEITHLNFKSKIIPDRNHYKINLNVENFSIFEKMHENDNLNISVKPLLMDDEMNEKGKMLSAKMVFDQLSKSELSTFFVITIEYNGDRVRRIIKIETEGMPDNRNEDIISSILDNEAAFIRYVSFLFGDDFISLPDEESFENDNGKANNQNKEDSGNKENDESDLTSPQKVIKFPALYEKMLDAVVNHENRFDEVEYLIQTLPKKVIPEGFIELHNTFKEALK